MHEVYPGEEQEEDDACMQVVYFSYALMKIKVKKKCLVKVIRFVALHIPGGPI